MKFKHLNCPVCGRQLVNLADEKTKKAGVHHFWCDVCDIDVYIDENKTLPRSTYDDDDEEEDNIPWNEWLS
jgi:transcription elongation factor Elf1